MGGFCIEMVAYDKGVYWFFFGIGAVFAVIGYFNLPGRIDDALKIALDVINQFMLINNTTIRRAFFTILLTSTYSLFFAALYYFVFAPSFFHLLENDLNPKNTGLLEALIGFPIIAFGMFFTVYVLRLFALDVLPYLVWLVIAFLYILFWIMDRTPGRILGAIGAITFVIPYCLDLIRC